MCKCREMTSGISGPFSVHFSLFSFSILTISITHSGVSLIQLPPALWEDLAIDVEMLKQGTGLYFCFSHLSLTAVTLQPK